VSPLASYSRLFRLAGPAYVVGAFIARLPLAMSQLGVLLLVAGASDSYALGGLAAGALAVANAIGAPIAGALADRHGQRQVVLVQSLAGAAGLVLLVALVDLGARGPGVVAAAALAGSVMPQVGPLARVRWRPITAATGLEQRRLVDVAFSYEGAADEASFAIGPALVGLMVVLLSPGGALLLAAGMLALFGSAFALHRTGRVVREAGSIREVGRLVTPVLLMLFAAQLLVGTLFGATQTGTTVLATQAGQPGVAGLIHATLGVGSAVAGVATAFLPERIGPERRILGAALALWLLSLPLLLVDGLLGLLLVVAVLGCAVAPFMIGVFTLAERVVDPGRVATAMTVLASATGLGYATGSTIAGRLADVHGHTAAFAVTVTATAIALLLAIGAQRRLRRELDQARLRESASLSAREVVAG